MGSVQVTARDVAAVGWLAANRCAWVDDYGACLAALVGRSGLGDRAVRLVVARQVELGLVERHRVWAGQPSVLTVTRRGARLVGWQASSVSLPAITQLQHACAISHVSLLTAGWGRWVSEAVVWRDYRQLPRKPDAILVTPTVGQVAVEVELTCKTKDRTKRILLQLLANFPAVQFWCGSPQVVAHVGRVIDTQLLAAEAARVQIHSIDSLINKGVLI